MIGRTIDRYKIIAKIGEGAMGSVWKAEDPVLGRDVALKFLPPSVSHDPDARKRFLRGARAASTLNHAGIAAVFDAGEVDDEGANEVYIAIEFVDGQTLRDKCVGDGFSIEGAVRATLQACEALHHAHSKRILHRDIKSANIMMTNDGRVVIVDFGLARLEEGTALTDTGLTVGTPAYMAPEVVRGEQADRRSDLYGLGVVLYELLTGRLPFEAQHQVALVHLVLNKQQAPPSVHNPEIPPELDAIVKKALAKDLDDRYQNTSDMASDLRAFLGGDVSDIVAITGSTRRPLRYRLSRITRNRRFVSFIVIAALLTAATWWWRRPPVIPVMFRSIAVLPLEYEGTPENSDDWLGPGIGEMLVTKLMRIPGLQVRPWQSSQRYSTSTQSTTEIASRLEVEAVLTGTVRSDGTRIEGSVQLVDGKTGEIKLLHEFIELQEDAHKLPRKIAMDIVENMRIRLSRDETTRLQKDVTNNASAFEYYIKGRNIFYSEEEQSLRDALEFFSRAVDLDPGLALAYVGIGAVHAERYFQGWEGGRKSLELAEHHYRKALELAPDLVQARRGIIRLYWYEGKIEKILQQGAEVARLGRNDVEAVAARAEAYLFGALPEKATPLFERIIEEDPANESAWWHLVISYAWSCAREQLLETAEEYFARFGEHPEIHKFVALGYSGVDDFDAAKLHLQRAIALMPDDHRNYIELALLYHGVGDYEEKTYYIERATDLLLTKLRMYPDNARIRSFLVVCYAYLGRRDEVLANEARCLTLAPEDGHVAMWLSWGRYALGDTLVAASHLSSAFDLGWIPHWTEHCTIDRIPKLGGSVVMDSVMTRGFRSHDRLSATY